MCIAVTLCVPAARAQTDFCLPDADHDGHPMFGNPQVRTGFELYQGEGYAATAQTAAFGDLDGDGDADGVVVSNTPGPLGLHYVTVHLNHGDGVLEPAEAPYPVGKEGADIALGDLDADGDLDAATANAGADTVSILLNHGDATFAPHVEYPVGQRPRSVGMADLDEDGDLDLAVLNVTSGDVSLLRNKGGTFAPEVRVFVGGVTPEEGGLPGPFLAVGDLDGDGDADIAVPSDNKVKVLLNDGLGAFVLAAAHPSVAVPRAWAIAITDLDGDTDADLAVTSVHGGLYGPNILSVILGTGGGAFAPAQAYNAGTVAMPQYATSITAGDIDADLDIDLVVGHELGGRVMLMRNLGNGAFAPKEEIRVYLTPWFVRLAELNGDNRLDLAVLTTWGRSKLCVLLNDGAGSVITDARYPSTGGASGTGWNWLETADLDGDGDLDLVVSAHSSQAPVDAVVFLNNGSGAFSIIHQFALAPSAIPATGESVSIGELNGDGVPDLVICDAIVPGGFDQPGRVWTVMGQGDGHFHPATPYPLSGLIPKHSAVVDLDNDGDNDLAVWSNEIYPGNDITPVDRRIVLLRNLGSGAMTGAGSIHVGTFPYPFPLGSVAAGDWDNDGDVDLAGTAGTNSSPGVLVAFESAGEFEFRVSQSFPTPPAPLNLLGADMNRDGSDDLILTMASGWNVEREYLHIYLNAPKGTFILHATYKDPLGFAGSKLAVGRDKGSTTVLALPNDVFAMVHRVRADGTLSPHTNYGTGHWPTAVVLGDFNGDNRLDLATSNSSDSGIVSVLLNRACDGCYADCDADGVLATADFSCFQAAFIRLDPYADCNADGALTVADFTCFQSAFVAGCP